MKKAVTGTTDPQLKHLLRKIRPTIALPWSSPSTLKSPHYQLLARQAFIYAWLCANDGARSLKPKDIPEAEQNGTYQFDKQQGTIAYTGGSKDHAWMTQWHTQYQAKRLASAMPRKAQELAPAKATSAATPSSASSKGGKANAASPSHL